MKSSTLLSLFAIGGMIVSTAAAQTPAPADQSTAQPTQMKSHRRAMGGPQMARLTKQLNLTVDQQNQARAIFQAARQQAKSVAPQVRTERQQMADAIKSGNEAQIDQITQQNAQLNSSTRASHAKAMAKFYSILTPDQKTRFDTLRANGRMNANGKFKANKAKNG
jgi:Spy/CpxP family protein refolding chaperone